MKEIDSCISKTIPVPFSGHASLGLGVLLTVLLCGHETTFWKKLNKAMIGLKISSSLSPTMILQLNLVSISLFFVKKILCCLQISGNLRHSESFLISLKNCLINCLGNKRWVVLSQTKFYHRNRMTLKCLISKRLENLKKML